MKLIKALMLLPLVGLLGCADDPTPPPLRSLRGMSDSSLLCLAIRDEDIELGDAAPRQARPLSACPDFNSDDGETRRLHALLTQPETGEVALVDLQRGRVVDTEVGVPGISFLPVGSEPVSVVSTPGGVASFVATRAPGKPGIYAMPTSCVGPRTEDQVFVDVTSWPACRLPAEPGSMEILIDPVMRSSCDGAVDPSAVQVGAAVAASRLDCPADLATEQEQFGRRKLVVALPSQGELLVIDAQALLDRAPGSFDACPIERTLQLGVDLPTPALEQPLPSDLPERALACVPSGAPYGAGSSVFVPHPVDFAAAPGKLYVADLVAPVVHVLDSSDPCSLLQLPPLLPQSYTEPEALVTTRKVAVSALTSKGERFVYAIEESSAPTAGSVMVFDVGNQSASRTPIIRPGAARIVHEPPDRIQFAQEAADVEFVTRSLTAFDPVTGVNVDQVACDPRETDPSAPSAQFQPNQDLTVGAAPTVLHGEFALIALHNGQVVVVDVDDLDAPCRRPISVNPSLESDFKGCAGDPNVDFSNPQTVTDEISCGVVQPHRARSSTYFINDARRARAAAVRQFPRLTSATGRPLPTDQTENGKKNPMLLAVPFEQGEVAQVFVGSSLYESVVGAENELITDPARAERSSITLSLIEPRQFLPNEQFSLTYEGSFGVSATTRVEPRAERGFIDETAAGRFCSQGVQDVAATRQFAEQFFPNGISDSDLNDFLATHTDYVQLLGDFPDDDDDYWRSADGQACGIQLSQGSDDLTPFTGPRFCDLWFGTSDAPTLRRDLRVAEAFQNKLWVEPRYGGVAPDVLMELVGCCFPEMTRYTVRAGRQWVVTGNSSRFQHNMTVEPGTGRCVHSCDPVVQGRTSRALEISCQGDCPVAPDGLPIIGLATTSGGVGDRDLACVINNPEGGVLPGQAGAECLFQSGVSRFAVYRGREPSARDMKFSWQLRGGFSPLTVNLSRAGNSVPEKLHFVPSLQTVLVVDGGSAGLGLVRLDTLSNRTIN